MQRIMTHNFIKTRVNAQGPRYVLFYCGHESADLVHIPKGYLNGIVAILQ